MPFEAVVGTGFDRDADALCFAPLTERDGLRHAAARVTREGIVQIPDEEIPVIRWQGHKRPSHDDEFNFVHIVAQLLQLIHTTACLQVWIVMSTNGSH